MGQRVRLQNVGTKDWDLKGTVERLRYADDGRVVSYYIMTDLNNLTTRHRRYLKPLHPEHDPRNPENDKIIAHKNTDVGTADLPNITPVKGPRRSSRTSKVKSIRTGPSSLSLDNMGSELSSIKAPLSVNIELTVGEEELSRMRELWNLTVNTRDHGDGERAERQEHANRQASARDTGSTVNATLGGAGVTRAGGAVSTAGGATARAGGLGGNRRDMDSAGCSSDNTGPIRTRNVKFIKSGRCHKLACKGHTGRRYDRSHGLITPATNVSETKTTETITITDMESSDEESIERMEKRLAKLLELKFKRRNFNK